MALILAHHIAFLKLIVDPFQGPAYVAEFLLTRFDLGDFRRTSDRQTNNTGHNKCRTGKDAGR